MASTITLGTGEGKDMTIRVILAEDHQMFRQAMQLALAAHKDIEIVGEANNGREAVDLVVSLIPDVVVMDISMAQLNGIDATREIRAKVAPSKVIVLSQHTDEQQVIQALRAGARGYVVKNAALDELVLAIQAVQSGSPYLSPAILPPVLNGYLAWTEQQGDSYPMDRLTPRERQVWQLVAEGRINQEIAEELELGVRTIETHRAKLMNKLDAHNVAELVRLAVRHGVVGGGQ
jgi:DNA-binding NarL/FixJ family response regulator